MTCGLETKMSNVTWGFIGLGHMGYPMAEKLRANMPITYTLLILEVNSKVMDQFVDENQRAAKDNGSACDIARVEIAQNARELAERSTVVITCLPTPQIVKDVFDSIFRGGKLPPLQEERLFVDSSTIDPMSSREIATNVRTTLGSQFVDAPVSGGVVAARAGTLSFMFGASPQSKDFIERIKSILSLMGKKTLHIGEQGAGVVGKLANNYILAINNIATAEAMIMGLQWGLDPVVLTDLINSSTGRCWPTEVNNPVPGVIDGAPASKGYEAGGTIGVIHKDLRLAMTGAQNSGISLTLADKANEVYAAVGKVYCGKDLSVVYKWMQDRASKTSDIA